MTACNLELPWQTFVSEVEDIQVEPASVLRVMLEASDVARLAGVSMEGLPDFGYRQRGTAQCRLALGLELAVHVPALRQWAKSGRPPMTGKERTRYAIWRGRDDKDAYGIDRADTEPPDKEKCDLMHTFDAKSWKDAKRIANQHISKLRATEMKRP
ncbi:MAG: hypothetical protein JNM56_02975 [Planctomycetia bacterium]|nr:hypothetical protein [Planctomycetia bacterium]